MTTTVIVKTHSWPVEVAAFPLEGGEPVEGAEWTSIGKVDPDSECAFYVHSGIDLMVRELPLPETPPSADDD